MKDDGWIRSARVLTGSFVMFAIRLMLTIVEGWQVSFNVLFKVGFNSTSIKTAPLSIHIFVKRAGRREGKRNNCGGVHIPSLRVFRSAMQTFTEILQEKSHEVVDLVVFPVIQILPVEALTDCLVAIAGRTIYEKLGIESDVNAFSELFDIGRRTSVAERKNVTDVCQSFKWASGMNSTHEYSRGEWVAPSRGNGPGAQTSLHNLQ
ncbi:hypothetical protein EDD85DRAFT_793611 [Armillaria nabsnona]|nr:hypothetical protein EDD85DRAFT_793611 [Armillaria nabsnona]